jgi:hypothetical protein
MQPRKTNGPKAAQFLNGADTCGRWWPPSPLATIKPERQTRSYVGTQW